MDDRSARWADADGRVLLTNVEQIGRLADDPAIDVPGLTLVADSALAMRDFPPDPPLTPHAQEDADALTRWAIRRLAALVNAGNQAPAAALERITAKAKMYGVV